MIILFYYILGHICVVLVVNSTSFDKIASTKVIADIWERDVIAKSNRARNYGTKLGI